MELLPETVNVRSASSCTSGPAFDWIPMTTGPSLTVPTGSASVHVREGQGQKEKGTVSCRRNVLLHEEAEAAVKSLPVFSGWFHEHHTDTDKEKPTPTAVGTSGGVGPRSASGSSSKIPVEVGDEEREAARGEEEEFGALTGRPVCSPSIETEKKGMGAWEVLGGVQDHVVREVEADTKDEVPSSLQMAALLDLVQLHAGRLGDKYRFALLLMPKNEDDRQERTKEYKDEEMGEEGPRANGGVCMGVSGDAHRVKVTSVSTNGDPVVSFPSALVTSDTGSPSPSRVVQANGCPLGGAHAHAIVSSQDAKSAQMALDTDGEGVSRQISGPDEVLLGGNPASASRLYAPPPVSSSCWSPTTACASSPMKDYFIKLSSATSLFRRFLAKANLREMASNQAALSPSSPVGAACVGQRKDMRKAPVEAHSLSLGRHETSMKGAQFPPHIRLVGSPVSLLENAHRHEEQEGTEGREQRRERTLSVEASAGGERTRPSTGVGEGFLPLPLQLTSSPALRRRAEAEEVSSSLRAELAWEPVEGGFGGVGGGQGGLLLNLNGGPRLGSPQLLVPFRLRPRGRFRSSFPSGGLKPRRSLTDLDVEWESIWAVTETGGISLEEEDREKPDGEADATERVHADLLEGEAKKNRQATPAAAYHLPPSLPDVEKDRDRGTAPLPPSKRTTPRVLTAPAAETRRRSKSLPPSVVCLCAVALPPSMPSPSPTARVCVQAEGAVEGAGGFQGEEGVVSTVLSVAAAGVATVATPETAAEDQCRGKEETEKEVGEGERALGVKTGDGRGKKEEKENGTSQMKSAHRKIEGYERKDQREEKERCEGRKWKVVRPWRSDDVTVAPLHPGDLVVTVAVRPSGFLVVKRIPDQLGTPVTGSHEAPLPLESLSLAQQQLEVDSCFDNAGETRDTFVCPLHILAPASPSLTSSRHDTALTLPPPPFIAPAAGLPLSLSATPGTGSFAPPPMALRGDARPSVPHGVAGGKGAGEKKATDGELTLSQPLVSHGPLQIPTPPAPPVGVPFLPPPHANANGGFEGAPREGEGEVHGNRHGGNGKALHLQELFDAVTSNPHQMMIPPPLPAAPANDVLVQTQPKVPPPHPDMSHLPPPPPYDQGPDTLFQFRRSRPVEVVRSPASPGQGGDHLPAVNFPPMHSSSLKTPMQPETGPPMTGAGKEQSQQPSPKAVGGVTGEVRASQWSPPLRQLPLPSAAAMQSNPQRARALGDDEIPPPPSRSILPAAAALPAYPHPAICAPPAPPNASQFPSQPQNVAPQGAQQADQLHPSTQVTAVPPTKSSLALLRMETALPFFSQLSVTLSLAGSEDKEDLPPGYDEPGTTVKCGFPPTHHQQQQQQSPQQTPQGQTHLAPQQSTVPVPQQPDAAQVSSAPLDQGRSSTLPPAESALAGAGGHGQGFPPLEDDGVRVGVGGEVAEAHQRGGAGGGGGVRREVQTNALENLRPSSGDVGGKAELHQPRPGFSPQTLPSPSPANQVHPIERGNGQGQPTPTPKNQNQIPNHPAFPPAPSNHPAFSPFPHAPPSRSPRPPLPKSNADLPPHATAAAAAPHLPPHPVDSQRQTPVDGGARAASNRETVSHIVPMQQQPPAVQANGGALQPTVVPHGTSRTHRPQAEVRPGWTVEQPQNIDCPPAYDLPMPTANSLSQAPAQQPIPDAFPPPGGFQASPAGPADPNHAGVVAAAAGAQGGNAGAHVYPHPHEGGMGQHGAGLSVASPAEASRPVSGAVTGFSLPREGVVPSSGSFSHAQPPQVQAAAEFETQRVEGATPQIHRLPAASALKFARGNLAQQMQKAATIHRQSHQVLQPQQGEQMMNRAFPTSVAGGAGGGTVTQNQQAAVGINNTAGAAGAALPVDFPEPWRQQGWGGHMIQDPNRQHSQIPTTAQAAVSGAVAVHGSHRDAAATVLPSRPLPLPAEQPLRQMQAHGGQSLTDASAVLRIGVLSAVGDPNRGPLRQSPPHQPQPQQQHEVSPHVATGLHLHRSHAQPQSQSQPNQQHSLYNVMQQAIPPSTHPSSPAFSPPTAVESSHLSHNQTAAPPVAEGAALNPGGAFPLPRGYSRDLNSQQTIPRVRDPNAPPAISAADLSNTPPDYPLPVPPFQPNPHTDPSSFAPTPAPAFAQDPRQPLAQTQPYSSLPQQQPQQYAPGDTQPSVGMPADSRIGYAYSHLHQATQRYHGSSPLGQQQAPSGVLTQQMHAAPLHHQAHAQATADPLQMQRQQGGMAIPRHANAGGMGVAGGLSQDQQRHISARPLHAAADHLVQHSDHLAVHVQHQQQYRGPVAGGTNTRGVLY
uniref:Uncharacterized protein n=1 Tax=Chromera velia CCMP2878 TaxID=1169474 RepID=A0A0G4GTP0_9ALVE|eukprot:Cvel_23274.t1-p1 / transcript=Cvel_23274.t1 / gene=Cvel_23274 / organism=Chromera_velia_CCMP2878 / gene_product=hypothetical protein / transcript_product=hypothetical protein / location=Cvel_scaffold2380:6971-15409(-) / protein_length=2297 / sequence_SO=supercontig / SO=protein_coding / is_pseudo=false